MKRARGAHLVELPAQLNPERRLTAEQAMALLGMGRTKFYCSVKEGALPAPVVREARFTRWRAGDLLDALNAGRR